MALIKVPNLEFFWRWWSVQLGILSASLSAAAVAYGTMLSISPALVAGVPPVIGTMLTAGAMVSAAAGVWLRRYVQPKLPSNTDGGYYGK